MKKRKKFFKDDDLNNKITYFKDKIVLPQSKIKTNKIIDSNKDIVEIKKIIPKKKIINIKLDIIYDKVQKKCLPDLLKKTKIYQLKPTKEQHNILIFWFDIYIDMYNKVLEKFKTQRKEESIKQNKILKYNEINYNLNGLNGLNALQKEFSNFKKELTKKINPHTKKENKINKHILNYAIKDAISSLKSIISNLNKEHIKKTRLRYLKKNKNNKIIKIEKLICQENSFCSSILGKKVEVYPKLKFNSINEVATLQYNKKKNTFKFLVKEKDDIVKNKNKNPKIIALDPGVRTFLTGISQDHILEIGIEPLKKIKPIIKKMDKIKENKKKIKNFKKQMDKYEFYIENYIKDLHNKIIKKIVDDYDEILIGKISTKSIVENKSTKTELKRELNILKMYQFREKLKIKCIKKDKKLKLVNEYNTSKTCSNCGNIKKDLGGNKKYKCEKCNKEYDRDVNASKNILLKGISTLAISALNKEIKNEKINNNK